MHHSKTINIRYNCVKLQQSRCLYITSPLLAMAGMVVFILTHDWQRIQIPISVSPDVEKVISITWNCPLDLSRTTYPYYHASWCTTGFLEQPYEEKLKIRENLFFRHQLNSTLDSNPLTACERNLMYEFRKARASTNRTDVIVYLTQKRSHTVYKRDVFRNTEDSLNMLYYHYSAIWTTDILLLTNVGAFNDHDRAILSLNGTRRNLRFFEIAGPYWDYVPECIDPKRDLKKESQFSFGYRQMIRLYSSTLPHLLHQLGYEWMMRMDEESQIHSNISYNLFQFMRTMGKVYGCRILVREVSAAFRSHVDRFFQHRQYPSARELFSLFRDEGCYNNWYISKVSFWLTPPVQDIVNYMDVSGGNFYFRWNDILTQNGALAFLNSMNEFHLFTDFTYSHLTMTEPPRGGYGGLMLGTDHSIIHGVTPTENTLNFLRNYGALHRIRIRGKKCALVPEYNFQSNNCD